ncbi:MAG: methyltransferase domain-containing protein [bacterium]|jgi:ubiquinone/menaquinone biosynthesis C-methylase UbiE|nr:methyltransferase domain-containing protein [bacterium]
MVDIEHLLKTAAEHAHRGDVDAVESLFLAALKAEPTQTDVMAHLGFFYAQMGRTAKALAVFEQRGSLVPSDANCSRLMGDLYRAAREYRAAQRAYQTARHEGDRSPSTFWFLWKMAGQGTLAELRQALSQRIKKAGIWKAYRLLLLSLMAAGVWLFEKSGAVSSSSFSLSAFLRFLRRYDPEGWLEGYAYHKTREAMLASAVLPWQDPAATLLDIGTGKNSLPLYWAQGGAHMIALDGSDYGFSRLTQVQARLEAGGTAGPFSPLCGDGCCLPLQADSIDAASVLCVLEHIPRNGDIVCMEELYRVLKPGGRAVVTVETSAQPEERWLVVPYEIGYQVDGAVPGTARLEEVFCRNYSPDTAKSRLAGSAPWLVLDVGFYDDTLLPLRRWLDPKQHRLLSSLGSALQPLLSLLFYRKKSAKKCSPSSIGYLVLQKSNVKSC